MDKEQVTIQSVNFIEMRDDQYPENQYRLNHQHVRGKNIELVVTAEGDLLVFFIDGNKNVQRIVFSAKEIDSLKGRF